MNSTQHLKETLELKIGISKFCDLRPKNCVTVGARGTHSVCVCKIHQNVKLMVGAVPLSKKMTYHDLLEQLLCSINSKLYMLHRCANCPGTTGLQTFLESKLEGTIVENDGSIVCKQWIFTDRTTLEESIKPISEYLDILIKK